jgi:hypothetical protein
MLKVRITDHVVQRYCQRVDPRATAAEARLVLGRMVSLGRVRSTPRHWMRNVNKTPGLVFLYWAELPGVCGLVLNGALVTLVTRELCQRDRHHLQLVPSATAPAVDRLPQLRLADAPKEAA